MSFYFRKHSWMADKSVPRNHLSDAHWRTTIYVSQKNLYICTHTVVGWQAWAGRAELQWAIPENIPPPWTTPNLVPKNFRISKKDNCSFCIIPEATDFKSWRIPEFRKNFNGFPGIPVKIYKILGIFVDFHSYSLSISYRISNVVHGVCVCVCVCIFSGIAQYFGKIQIQKWSALFRNLQSFVDCSMERSIGYNFIYWFGKHST